MKIRVIGSNIEVGDSLTKHVEENLQKEVTKYFENAVSGDVYFSKEGNLFKTLIVVNEGIKGGGIVVKSNSEAADVYGSFNDACEKCAKQLRRYKRKIKNYRRQGGIKSSEIDYSPLDGTKYIIPPTVEEEEKDTPVEAGLKIIAEKNTEIEELSIEQAIMKMDLADLPALVFVDDKSKRINVIYNRKDGNISWIDPIIR